VRPLRGLGIVVASNQSDFTLARSQALSDKPGIAGGPNELGLIAARQGENDTTGVAINLDNLGNEARLNPIGVKRRSS
jgi:hypothetical protein